MRSLAGKTIFITGGRGSIGRAIAAAALDAGAKVALADLSAPVKEDAGGSEEAQSVLHLSGDVSDPAAVAAMVAAAIERFGTIDILVNNAGVVSRRPILSENLSDWTRVLNVNLTACVVTVQAIAPLMIAAGWGRIINMSSIHGRVAKAGMGAYCASKAAIDMVTKQLAAELGQSGVTVNAVAPGTIATNLNRDMHSGHDPANVSARNANLARIPQGRFGRPEDVAAAVMFLASDGAAYVTGTTLYIDGGYTADGTP